MTKRPSPQAISILRDLHSAAQELEFHDKISGEWCPLKKGDRVVLEALDGDFTGTVDVDWEPRDWPSASLKVRLDCSPGQVIGFHRTMFRSFTVLDHLAES